jgi:PhnB protein
MHTYKPAGYNSVSPYLIVKDAAATIDFLQQVFAATTLYRLNNEHNRIAHAEMRVDDSVIMLADAQEGWSTQPAHVHIYVANVDSVYQSALLAGGLSVQAPTQKQDNDRRCGVQDIGGTTWWIASKID